MKLTASTRYRYIPAKNPEIKQLSSPPAFFNNTSFPLNHRNPSRICSSVRISNLRQSRLVTACITRSQETPFLETQTEDELERFEKIPSVSSREEERETAGKTGPVSTRREKFAPNSSIWNQMVEIVKFSGPATGMWICGPLMSLIDTAVIGQGSSLDLAALGPGTVLCDNMSYMFMFLSITASNMVATALARQGRKEVQRWISILLFVGLACGVLMLLLMKSQGTWLLAAFTGPKNAHVVPAANKYVQIRALAWPAVLVGWVAQSSSLGMKDSWGPLKALAVASTINVIGHVILCSYLGYGIAGAAWATMVSQVISAYMMTEALKGKGYSVLDISPPSPGEIMQILTLSAPVFVTISSKVAFYSLIVYFATSMGTVTVAAHQVLIQLYGICVVWGEPLSQTAQSFMPELMYGFNRSLAKARLLLKSLVIIGSLLGLLLGTIGTSIPLLFPQMFTSDPKVIQEMHNVLIPFFLALCVTPCTHSFEGTLLAGRDLKFISFTMSGCFCLGSLLLLLVSSRGYGLPGCWCVLVGFQWARFFLTLGRLISPHGVLYSEDLTQYQLAKPKIA